MAQFLGSDVGELRGFAKDISSAADDLDLASKKLTQLIVQNRGWQGPDAQRFTSQWHGRHRPTLAKVVQGLLTTSRELRVQADEQERTSLAADITSQGGATSPDHSSSRYPDRGSADLSEQALADLKVLVDKAADTDNIFRGNDADIEKLRKALDELTPQNWISCLRASLTRTLTPWARRLPRTARVSSTGKEQLRLNVKCCWRRSCPKRHQNKLPGLRNKSRGSSQTPLLKVMLHAQAVLTAMIQMSG